MMHHARGRQMHRAAVHQMAHGNVGAAMVLQHGARHQHAMGTAHMMRRHCRYRPHGMYRCVMWNPWMYSHWLVRRAIRREMVRHRTVVVVQPNVPIHEVVFVQGTQYGTVVPMSASSKMVICAEHHVENLPEVVEVTFDQGGRKTVLYADRKCTVCGQYFFCYPEASPVPYTAPSQQEANNGYVEGDAPPELPPPYTEQAVPVQQQQQPSAPYPVQQQQLPYPTTQPSMPQPAVPLATPVAAPPPAASCQACTMALPPGAKFCGVCGTKVPSLGKFCPSCGTEAIPNAKFCGNCGTSLAL